MKRRSEPLTSPVPRRLLDPDVWGSVEEWRAARADYAATHPWPGGVLARLSEQADVLLAERPADRLDEDELDYWPGVDDEGARG